MATQAQLVDKMNSIVPLHFLVPAVIGVLTLAAVSFLVSRSTIQDIYVPSEKHVIKVEEASLLIFNEASIANRGSSYGTTQSKA